ncbi:craniofacial development protein 2-like [Elysia marginata]|uniref:Craniofacial development protein 2-like n=1 Tax=Elysia marginata TaxID=1093978 RepID=A0AAV4I8C8_9GAST|nr:craniofacial development protein 2-like [Elysia marginata]
MSKNTFNIERNDVKGWSASSRSVSSGRNRHMPQVIPDRQQATACKLRQIIRVGTWNIRTLLQKGKLDNVKMEMETLNINILGLSEVRWKGANDIQTGKFRFLYSGRATHERGVGLLVDQEVSEAVKGYWPVSDRVLLLKISGKPMDLNIIQVYAPTSTSSEEEIKTFYEELKKAMSECTSQDPLIIMGDFNAKVGQHRNEKAVGKNGLGIRNERGEQLVTISLMSHVKKFF